MNNYQSARHTLACASSVMSNVQESAENAIYSDESYDNEKVPFKMYFVFSFDLKMIISFETNMFFVESSSWRFYFALTAIDVKK